MRDRTPVMGLLLFCMGACALFSCFGAVASMILADNANTAAETITDALSAGDTEQANRAVCVAGLFNLDSCNTSQTQTQPAAAPAADDDTFSWGDWLAWSIGGLLVLAFLAVVTMWTQPGPA